jgi:D-alanyl-D-alanine carboxypeptidase/D-alanyl-D-alanine-endopeptidase (penicillin-binding protein 4)
VPRTHPHIRPSAAIGPFLLTLAIAAAATADRRLAGEIERAIAGANLRGTTTAVSVREVGSNRELVAIASDTPLIPASNMKLLSSGAALLELGPEFRFQTRLRLAGDTLLAIGDGDPAFGDPDLLAATVFRSASGEESAGFCVERLVGVWVDAVVAAGVRSLAEVVVDDRVFDRERVHPGWPADQLNNHYCAEVAGFNFHLNCLHLQPRPSAGGGPPAIGETTPRAPWIEIANRATSRRQGDATTTAWVARRIGGNDLTLMGNVREMPAQPIRVTIHDPPQFFADLLAHRLRQAGVAVGGARVADPQEHLPEGLEIAPTVQTPIATVLMRSGVDSRNLHAEALLKRAAHARSGRPGSWADGAALLEAQVARRLGPRYREGLVVSDGSGLSRENRVRADLLTAWLAVLHRDPELRSPFRESLAAAGSAAGDGRSGTLRNRFRQRDLQGCSLFAKTGYIRGVSALSGYVVGPDGRTFAFSILMNGVRDLGAARALQDRLVERIASAAARRG